MLADNALNLIQFVGLEPIIGCEFNRVEPEFGLITLRFDMHMRWLLVFIAKKANR